MRTERPQLIMRRKQRNYRKGFGIVFRAIEFIKDGYNREQVLSYMEIIFGLDEQLALFVRMARVRLLISGIKMLVYSWRKPGR
jgi:hypothetical protein